MRLTRRGWEAAALVLGTAGFGVVTSDATWVAGGLALAALLLGLQMRFTRQVVALGADLRVDAGVEEDVTPVTGHPTPVTLRVERSAEQADLPIRVSAPASRAALTDRREDCCRLARGDRTDEGTATLTWQVAGEFDLEAPRVDVADAWGLFESSFEAVWADPTAVTVRPPEPWNVHVGRGGDLAVPGAGTDPDTPIGEAMTPAGLREYQPGDPVRHIDWKATARLQYPHVREFESETDVATTLVLDHGASMALGPPGRTKLDFAREVALSFVEAGRRHTESLGLYAAGDEGLTHAQAPRDSSSAYQQIERALLECAPTTVEERTPSAWRNRDGSVRTPGTGPRATPPKRPGDRPTVHYQPLHETLAVTRELTGDPTAYGRTVAPLLRGINPYEVAAKRPLFEAVGAAAGRSEREQVGIVLLTDDVDRPAVRQAVRAAQRRASHVQVFLHPTVLFDPGRPTALEDAYDEYLSFEAFRRELSSFDDVTAFEVGPGDRLDRILASADDAPADGAPAAEVAEG